MATPWELLLCELDIYALKWQSKKRKVIAVHIGRNK